MYTISVHSYCGIYIIFSMGYCILLSHEYFQANHQYKLHAKDVINDQGSAEAIEW